MALPSLILWLLFLIVPLGILFVYSFGQLDIITFKMSFDWTVDNYKRLTDALYLGAIVRSLILSVLATVLTLTLGIPGRLLHEPQKRCHAATFSSWPSSYRSG